MLLKPVLTGFGYRCAVGLGFLWAGHAPTHQNQNPITPKPQNPWLYNQLMYCSNFLIIKTIMDKGARVESVR